MAAFSQTENSAATLNGPVMSKRKRPKNPGAKDQDTLEENTSTQETAVTGPSSRFRVVATFLILLQFACLITSLAANLSPSLLQSNILDWIGPYVVTTGQDYGEVALEWTHGEEIEFPMLVQVHYAGDASDDWASLPPPGVRVSEERPVQWTQSRWSNFSRIIRLLYTDSGDNEILGEIIVDTLAADDSRRAGEIDQARLLSPVVINYRQYEEMKEVGGVTIAEAWPDSVVYTADIIKTPDGQLVVSPALPASRVSKSTLGGVGSGASR
jgi:hypothetical protein